MPYFPNTNLGDKFGFNVDLVRYHNFQVRFPELNKVSAYRIFFKKMRNWVMKNACMTNESLSVSKIIEDVDDDSDCVYT